MNHELALLHLEHQLQLREPSGRYTRSPQALRPRVLLVDDDAIGRRSSARWLATEFAVMPVASAEEALLCYRPHMFDIVITDYRMPEMTGIELLEQLRVREPRVRRVLVSGSFIPGIEGYIGSGIVEAYWQRPVDLRTALLDWLRR